LSDTEKKREYNGTVHWLFTDFKKDLVTREVLYNILTASCIPIKLVMLHIRCLNETEMQSKVNIAKSKSSGRNLLTVFTDQNRKVKANRETVYSAKTVH
jgi:hypothetical protein